MLKDITLGQYFPGNSPLHRLDPRTKLIATVALIIILFAAQGFSGLLAAALFTLSAAALSGIRLKHLIRGLKPILFIVLFTFALNLFVQTGGRVLFEWHFLHVTTDGLRLAVFTAARLMLLVMCSQLLTMTTSPISLTDGLESLMNPLKVIRFPAHEIAMMMSIALRFIPTLMEETDRIMKAQKARGADFESGSPVQRARALIPLLVPLFVGSFRRADELAMAMEARCYRGGEGRTRMKKLTFRAADLFAGVALALLLALVIALNRLNLF